MNSLRGKYNTKRKKLLLDILATGSPRHITVQSLVERLKGEVGQTTIYRNLEKLVNEGIVIKYDAPNGMGACYRYVGDGAEGVECYHFLCVGCGRMLHLNCDLIMGLTNHVDAEHGIKLNMKKTILYGSCELCKEKG